MSGRPLTSCASRFWVTCYTDASFGRSGAGWAVWARCVEGRVVRSGACPGYVTSSLEAELAAIFAGVFVACRTWGARIGGVVVRTDCQAAILLLTTDAVRPRTQKRWPGAMRLRAKILALVKERGIDLELRWVMGHQASHSVQAYLNRACDELAAAARGVACGPPGAPARRRRPRRRVDRSAAALRSTRRGGMT
ncbi:RNase H family protein [Sorangium sp. So ce341]|uniref:RNase H family protein n=1 Tax=Sorangium sp. So ce341 TaxID=3133302 RepID=UPI003F61357F